MPVAYLSWIELGDRVAARREPFQQIGTYLGSILWFDFGAYRPIETHGRRRLGRVGALTVGVFDIPWTFRDSGGGRLATSAEVCLMTDEEKEPVLDRVRCVLRGDHLVEVHRLASWRFSFGFASGAVLMLERRRAADEADPDSVAAVRLDGYDDEHLVSARGYLYRHLPAQPASSGGPPP